MDTTILCAIASCVQDSAISGITWDILKVIGGKIITSFKRIFLEKKSFKDEEQAEKFLKMISEKESYNEDNPLEDVWNMYKRCTQEKATEEFKNEFESWLKENANEFQKLSEKSNSPTGIVTIETQTITGGTVTIKGQETHYYR